MPINCRGDSEGVGRMKGGFHIMKPAVPVRIPIRLRDEMQSRSESLRAQLPRSVAVIFLWGGEKGREFTVSSSIIPPGGEPISLPVQRK